MPQQPYSVGSDAFLHTHTHTPVRGHNGRKSYRSASVVATLRSARTRIELSHSLSLAAVVGVVEVVEGFASGVGEGEEVKLSVLVISINVYGACVGGVQV